MPGTASSALAATLADARVCATSRVGLVEFRRVARRGGISVERTAAVVAALVTVELDEAIERLAAKLDVPLRAFDAIHLASALSLGDALTAFVCYDARLSDAALDAGLPAIAPA